MRLNMRRFPRLRDLLPYFKVRRPVLGANARVQRAVTIDDLRRIARRRVPRPVFDYVDGGAESEIALVRSVGAFREIEFHPRVLRDVSNVDLSTTVLGHPTRLPIGLAPTGFTRMMHHEGEPAVAAAASAAGIVYTLSTLGTTSPEALVSVVPGPHWFQLYVSKDRSATVDLIQRVRESGYAALVLTVDTPVGGVRLRDVRNGLTIPPSLTPKALAMIAVRPRWWFEALTREPLTFASMNTTDGTVADLLDRVFDPSLTPDDIAWVKAQWNGPLVVKGIQTANDAELAVRSGADGVVVSNHGGRQLDRAVSSLDALPGVVDAIGHDAEVYVDGGIRNGADAVAVLALGARACFVGRAYLYGLMAGGRKGVERAIAILTSEMERTLQLLGARDIAELTPEMVRLGRSRAGR